MTKYNVYMKDFQMDIPDNLDSGEWKKISNLIIIEIKKGNHGGFEYEKEYEEDEE